MEILRIGRKRTRGVFEIPVRQIFGMIYRFHTGLCREHGTSDPKPEKLLAKLLLASSSKGDVVLDPFAGSGTTAVVAKKLGRKFVAIEQNPLYGAWAQKRLEMAETDASIQGYEDGVFGSVTPEDKKRGRKYPCPLSYKIQRLFFRLH